MFVIAMQECPHVRQRALLALFMREIFSTQRAELNCAFAHPCVVTITHGRNARWTDIGVAWATKDGKGFTLALNAIPVNGRIVMRINDEKKGS